jgi:hypothetical protein
LLLQTIKMFYSLNILSLTLPYQSRQGYCCNTHGCRGGWVKPKHQDFPKLTLIYDSSMSFCFNLTSDYPDSISDYSDSISNCSDSISFRFDSMSFCFNLTSDYPDSISDYSDSISDYSDSISDYSDSISFCPYSIIITLKNK